MKDQFIDAVEFSIIVDYEEIDSDEVGHKRTLSLRASENETVGDLYWRILNAVHYTKSYQDWYRKSSKNMTVRLIITPKEEQ